ncbi:hypothetical protein CPAV1605_18 [seawater metagenome]|uniref:Uncharacterized protein n=1 Tax=seawater metagenome TaxID=1561972 RepID=A0A5E8CFP3_9ZZZZ
MEKKSLPVELIESDNESLNETDNKTLNATNNDTDYECLNDSHNGSDEDEFYEADGQYN